MGTQKFYLELTLSCCTVTPGLGGGACWAGRARRCHGCCTISSTDWVCPRTKNPTTFYVQPPPCTTPLHDQITPHAVPQRLKQESQFGSNRYFKKGRPYPVLSQCERRPWRVPIFDSLDLAHSLASLLNLRMPCLESTHTFLFLVKSGEQVRSPRRSEPDYETRVAR